MHFNWLATGDCFSLILIDVSYGQSNEEDNEYYREQQNNQYQKQEDKDWKVQTTGLKNINNPNEISEGV